MVLNITDEYSPLKKVIVCSGESVPESREGFNDTEFLKFHSLDDIWDKNRLLEQQKRFFDLLQEYGVELLLADVNLSLPWQIYTRDIGFVFKDKFFYSKQRTLASRVGEISTVVGYIAPQDAVMVEGKMEGGDVLVDGDYVYIGISNRTNYRAVNSLNRYFEAVPLYLGDDVMHLDTRMTILPNRHLLIYEEAFNDTDLRLLRGLFNLISVSKEEALSLGTNVFAINPETIVVDASQRRIANELRRRGFNIETIDYSEIIANKGSFRCTTLPLVRED